MLDPTDLVQALTVECPESACGVFTGERCVSWVTNKPLDVPHRKRVEKARAVAEAAR